jgi:hypothetical protein
MPKKKKKGVKHVQESISSLPETARIGIQGILGTSVWLSGSGFVLLATNNADRTTALWTTFAGICGIIIAMLLTMLVKERK